MTLKVGVMVGREWSFPPAFIDEVNRRDAGVTAEFVRLGGTQMNEPNPYAVIIDRISHEVPYYRSYLKNAVLQGTTVINNPFMWTADDKFFEASLADKLGVASPKTYALPNKEYVPGIVHGESLRNLVYPLNWDEILEGSIYLPHQRGCLERLQPVRPADHGPAGIHPLGTLCALYVPGPKRRSAHEI